MKRGIRLFHPTLQVLFNESLPHPASFTSSSSFHSITLLFCFLLLPISALLNFISAPAIIKGDIIKNEQLCERWDHRIIFNYCFHYSLILTTTVLKRLFTIKKLTIKNSNFTQTMDTAVGLIISFLTLGKFLHFAACNQNISFVSHKFVCKSLCVTNYQETNIAYVEFTPPLFISRPGDGWIKRAPLVK